MPATRHGSVSPVNCCCSNRFRALNMLAIGEETGEMDKMLSKVADFYEDEVGAMVKALTSMLEPAMIVVVGGIVGSILLAMYLPMFTVFDQIQ
jgi:type IV pilus assembly protein PilC